MSFKTINNPKKTPFTVDNSIIQDYVNEHFCSLIEKNADSAIIISFARSNSNTLKIHYKNFRMITLLMKRDNMQALITCKVIIHILGGIKSWQYCEVLPMITNEGFLMFFIGIGQKYNVVLDDFSRNFFYKNVAYSACRRGDSIETVEALIELGKIDSYHELISHSFIGWNKSLTLHLLSKYSKNIAPEHHCNLIVTAAVYGSIKIFDMLLDYLNINISDLANLVTKDYTGEELIFIDHLKELCSRDETGEMTKILNKYIK